MIKKLIYCFSLIIIVCMFAGCGGDIAVSAYIRDITDVAEGRSSHLYTTVRIIAEGLKDESDISFLRNRLNGFSNEKVVDYNYSDSLAFDIKVPLTKEENIGKFDSGKDLMFLIAEDNSDRIDIYCKINDMLLADLDNYIYNKHFTHIDLKEFEISFIVENDSREEKKIKTFSAYINNKPYPGINVITLQNRSRTEFRISEILRNAVADGYRYSIFSLVK